MADTMEGPYLALGDTRRGPCGTTTTRYSGMLNGICLVCGILPIATRDERERLRRLWSREAVSLQVRVEFVHDDADLFSRVDHFLREAKRLTPNIRLM